jgi:hypothetical protein
MPRHPWASIPGLLRACMHLTLVALWTVCALVGLWME